MKPQKILITGGAGFIGSHIAQHYHGKALVRVVDNLRTGNINNLEDLEIEFIKGSILDKKMMLEAVKGIDVIYHMAAFVSVAESMSNPQECEEINVRGLINTLQAANESGVKRLVFPSSAAIYGESSAIPNMETMRPDPQSPYAISKLAGEYYCDLFHRTTDLKTASLRFFNVFGPRQDPMSPYSAAIPTFIKQALENQPITIFGDGNQTRVFIAVKDIVEALVFAATGKISGIYNVGYGESTSINKIVKKVISLTESSSNIQYAAERVGDIKHSLACINKIKEAGFKAKGSLVDGLKKLVNYYKT